MLIKQVHLKRIRSGEITLAFRKWKKATVKTGSLLHTALGQVRIEEIDVVKEKNISESDALRAGFESRQELFDTLRQIDEGDIFRIKLCFHGEDPRIQLRQQSQLGDDAFVKLREKLSRFDQFSTHGAWTEKILHTIKDNPRLAAIVISKRTGFEKEWLKPNIRKLKNLGLTISHEVGYEISPFGKAFLDRLKVEKKRS